MNIKLFNDTLKLINGCFNKNNDITEDEFLYYLLGYTHSEAKNDIYLLTLEAPLKDCLTEKNTLRNVLGDNYSGILSNTQNLTIKTLVKIRFDRDPKVARNTETRLLGMQKELHALCEKYSLPYPDFENSEFLFRRLFTSCIKEKKPSYLFASQKKQQLKPATKNGTLGRTDDSQNLLHCLKQYHKVIISGQPGIGKSRFIQYCLTIWNLPDYCYICYASDLESTKKNILFYEDKDRKSEASLEDLTDKTFESSLLVIDHMTASENLSVELDELASYAINVIVITTADFYSDSFHTFSLSTLTDDTLQDIFENSSGISLEDENRDLLFLVSQKNVLLISLIAGQYKQIASQSTEQSEENTELLHRLLCSLDNTLTTHLPRISKENLTYKHLHDKKALDLLGHIKVIYSGFAKKYEKTHSLRRTMRFLCCFGYSAIPLSFLKLFPEYSQKDLDTLSEIGWIVQTDSTIQLPSLIARSVFANEVITFADCYRLIDTMTDFLRNYDQTLTTPYLSNILFVLASSISKTVKVKNNPNQKHASEEFENWLNLLYSIYNYYQENGDFRLSEKVIELIHYPDISHEHNNLDSHIFRFVTRMSQQNWIERISKEGENLMLMIGNDKTLIQTTSAPLLVALMDNAIYLYCTCLFSYYSTHFYKANHKEIIDYHHKLIDAVGTILYHIPPPRLNMQPKVSAAQYEYYHLCYELMKSSKRIFPSILEPLIYTDTPEISESNSFSSKILAEPNANYRIRSIAFTMFMRSLYRTDMQIMQSSPIDFSIYEKLILTIRCDISKLHEQIITCEQIPWHTTWITLFCYLQLLEEFSALYLKSNQRISTIYYSSILKTLLYRSTFTKEQLKEAFNMITPYFPI